MKDKTDEQLFQLHRGGHDPAKIYNAYKRAVEHKGGPTVILAKTVKGYGLGSAQARNATHSEKKLTDESLAEFVKHFDIPMPEDAAKHADFYRPDPSDPAIAIYAGSAAPELGGSMPKREVPKPTFEAPKLDFFHEWIGGSKGRAVSTTGGFVASCAGCMKDPKIGKLIVPIVPDEGRTFGLESAIKQVGIYAHEGQKYTPHDADMLLSYREENGRADSGRRHHGSWLDGIVHGGGNGLLELPHADDPVLHVLLDVRIPAHRRHGVGVCGFARQGLPDGRHRRAHDHARRRPAAPGRALATCWPAPSPPA